MKDPRVNQTPKFPLTRRSFTLLMKEIIKLHHKGELPPQQDIYIVERNVGNKSWYLAKLRHKASKWEFLITIYKTDDKGKIIDYSGLEIGYAYFDKHEQIIGLKPLFGK